jgi:uncharacterized membrane-anchored protein
VSLGAVAFTAALALALAGRQYQPSRYWFAVAMVGVFGTMAADVLHVGLHIPYAATSALCALMLGVVFWQWQEREGTLSIHSISNRRREGFYWMAVVATFAVGTAVGDLTAVQFHLGYSWSIVLFASLLAGPAVMFAARRSSEVFTFWMAYVLTRPLGASIADWVGVSRVRGGLNAGPGNVALILALAIVVLVSVEAVRTRRSATP